MYVRKEKWEVVHRVVFDILMLLRFSLQSVGGERIALVAGQACKRVRLQSNRWWFPREACCDQE